MTIRIHSIKPWPLSSGSRDIIPPDIIFTHYKSSLCVESKLSNKVTEKYFCCKVKYLLVTIFFLYFVGVGLCTYSNKKNKDNKRMQATKGFLLNQMEFLQKYPAFHKSQMDYNKSMMISY